MNFAGVVVINLPERQDRLRSFVHSLRSSDLSGVPLYHLRAVDGKRFQDDAVLERTLPPKALEEWKELQRTRQRKFHGQIASCGAMGCFSSHMNAWKFVAQHGRASGQMHQPFIVAEDDVRFWPFAGKNGMETYMDAKAKHTDAPLVFKMHAWPLKVAPNGSVTVDALRGGVFEPKLYWGTSAYAISPYDAQLLLELPWAPFDAQIDTVESRFRDAGKLHLVAQQLASINI